MDYHDIDITDIRYVFEGDGKNSKCCSCGRAISVLDNFQPSTAARAANVALNQNSSLPPVPHKTTNISGSVTTVILIIDEYVRFPVPSRYFLSSHTYNY